MGWIIIKQFVFYQTELIIFTDVVKIAVIIVIVKISELNVKGRSKPATGGRLKTGQN